MNGTEDSILATTLAAMLDNVDGELGALTAALEGEGDEFREELFAHLENVNAPDGTTLSVEVRERLTALPAEVYVEKLLELRA